MKLPFTTIDNGEGLSEVGALVEHFAITPLPGILGRPHIPTSGAGAPSSARQNATFRRRRHRSRIVMSVKNLVANPTPYVIWALIVVGALFGTYFGNPYVFGFTALGLMWLTIAIGILGLAICLFSQRLQARDRVFILAALAIAAVAIAAAFQTLGTFNWA